MLDKTITDKIHINYTQRFFTGGIGGANGAAGGGGAIGLEGGAIGGATVVGGLMDTLDSKLNSLTAESLSLSSLSRCE